MKQVIAEFIQWAEETFPGATPESCVAHLRREVEELAADPWDGEELADAAMLIFHAAHRAGVDMEAAIRDKLAINRRRSWGPANEEGFREHVRRCTTRHPRHRWQCDAEQGHDGPHRHDPDGHGEVRWERCNRFNKAFVDGLPLGVFHCSREKGHDGRCEA